MDTPIGLNRVNTHAQLSIGTRGSSRAKLIAYAISTKISSSFMSVCMYVCLSVCLSVWTSNSLFA